MADLTGQKFGKLIVIERHAANKWRCRCECGKVCTPETDNLKGGNSRSCGCARGRKGSSPGLLKPGVAFRRLLRNYKRHAEDRNIPWLLSEEEFRNITSSPCYYTGQLPDKRITEKWETYVYNGVDRLDSAGPYTLTNCVPCSTNVNRAKMSMSVTDFLELCRRVHTHQELRT